LLIVRSTGEGFAADSFGGLENEKTPELLNHIDEVFPALWVWWMFPKTSAILQFAPFEPVRNFICAADDFKKVSSTDILQNIHW
jgi:hypothetical protein